MQLSSVKTSRLGALGLGAAMLIGAGGCRSSIYDPARELMKADENGDGILTRGEAAKFIVNKFDQSKKGGSRNPRTNERRHGLSKDEIEAAREFGNQAKQFLPEHGRVFLETLSILERIYRDPFEEDSEIMKEPNRSKDLEEGL